MRALVGIVGLLVVLAIVGLLASQQLRATRTIAPQAAPSGAASATAREQARQVQDRVRSEVGQALQQGAANRGDEAAK